MSYPSSGEPGTKFERAEGVLSGAKDVQISHSTFNNIAGNAIFHERVVNENIIFQFPVIQNRDANHQVANYEQWSVSSKEISTEWQIVGSGYSSTVYVGSWNGTKVAIKQLAKETPRQMLIKEIEIWRRLRHPHVAPFLRACIESNPPFLVSELYQFGNAVEYLSKFPSAKRLNLCHEISLGMRYLHGQNIIHGDLKPANVLIDDGRHVRITDFGLSKVKSSTSTRILLRDGEGARQHIFGTRVFMAPECLDRGIVTYATDVYAFGMSVYQIMTGDAPFKYLHEDDIRQVVLKEGQRPQRPEGPEFLERGLTNPMWGLMELCWADDEKKRPQFLGIVQSMERLNNTTASAKPDSDEDDYIVYMRGLYTENLLENDSMRQLPLSASIEIDGKHIWTRNISRKKGDPDDKYPSFVVRQSSNISIQVHHNNVDSNWKLGTIDPPLILVVLSGLELTSSSGHTKGIERDIFVKGSRYGKLCFVARVSDPIRLDDSGFSPLKKEPDWEKAPYYISIKVQRAMNLGQPKTMRNMLHLSKPRPHPQVSKDSKEIKAYFRNHGGYNTNDAKNPIWHWEFRLVVQKASAVRINIIDDNRQGKRDECIGYVKLSGAELISFIEANTRDDVEQCKDIMPGDGRLYFCVNTPTEKDWKIRRTPAGRISFFHAETRKTSWLHPKCEERVPSSGGD